MSNALLISHRIMDESQKENRFYSLLPLFFNGGAKSIVRFRTCFGLSFSPLFISFYDANKNNNFDINQ